MREELYVRLQRAMDIRKMRQVDLCEKTGISKSKMSQYVRGDHSPKLDAVYLLAQALDVQEAWLMGYDVPMEAPAPPTNAMPVNDVYRIPLLGRVAAGEPLFIEENIVGEVFVDPAMVPQDAQLYALKVKGDSMAPKIMDGDTLIVREASCADDGEIVIVTVNGQEGTCKKIKRYPDALALISLNQLYEPIMYTWQEVEQLPVKVVGKVIQARREI